MSKENKALLLNIFVCPGGGHLYLGKKLTGWAILAITAVSLALLMTDIMAVSQQVADDILAGKVPLDLTALATEVHQRTMAMDLGYAFWLLVTAWAVGVLDSIRLIVSAK
ncbi:hypothetical protein L2750_07640 [Shewanella submarina]|uniref:TM2 domain-containing protein n=1 Tax=Shewanella submarina TaxID=2016376 RepID=A0ABV7GB28_9GAMM|nr:hypothetical protein [Shewanella submarina]MCL1037023.1 hypothetical protein [Shewanella submarina]